MPSDNWPAAIENQRMSLDEKLDGIHQNIRESFEGGDRVRSFRHFLADFCENPGLHLRTAAQYMVDMFDFFGTRASSRVGQEAIRYRVFDKDLREGEPVLVGQERVQESIYRQLLASAKRGKTDKMLLLHGPNGSGKTTIIECLIAGMEHYSKTDGGQLLKFNWIFTEREGKLDRIGFEKETLGPDAAASYALLDQKDISAKFQCELHDSPVFLIPREHRQGMIDDALKACPTENRPKFSYDFFLSGDLCQKCKTIYDALLHAYHGDWRKVLRHVQVERYFVSKRYRMGAISIEPQGNVDASVQPLNHEHSWNIPPLLRNLSLYSPVGDIVDANRGILEYSDFLKRPLEASKYLLTTCEQGTVNLTNCMAYLDLVITATSNEKQLNIFKRSPDFSSFKGRMELIAVPYLLRYSTEIDLYKRRIRSFSRERHVTPHASEVAALWAVLTRLRRPDANNYIGPIGSIVAKLTPVEKAKLYDSGEVPTRFSEEERKAIRSAILDVRCEFAEDEGEFEGIYGAEYEGRRGASAREMMSILARAAEMRQYHCLTPMAIFEALEELLKDASVYDFLRVPVEGGYRDVRKFLEDVRQEYFRWVTEEVYDSINLIDEAEYNRFFLEYFRHVKAFHTKESVYNERTNSYDPPNADLMDSVEKLLKLTDPVDLFRSQIITRIAAWSLDHPQASIEYEQLFPEIYDALRDNFYHERNRLLRLIEQDILKFGTDEFGLLSPSEQDQVVKALATMKSKYGYCEHCARDVIAYVLRCRSEVEEQAT
jgi:serine protein kinase